LGVIEWGVSKSKRRTFFSKKKSRSFFFKGLLFHQICRTSSASGIFYQKPSCQSGPYLSINGNQNDVKNILFNFTTSTVILGELCSNIRANQN